MRTIKDVMTHGMEVIHPDTPLREAAEKMRRFNIRSVPVCDGDKLVGVVTDRDIVVRGIAMGHDPHSSRVSSVMSEDTDSLPPSASLDEAADLMEDRRLHRLWVVDDAGRLVGIVSLGDLSQEAGDITAGRMPERSSEPSR